MQPGRESGRWEGAGEPGRDRPHQSDPGRSRPGASRSAPPPTHTHTVPAAGQVHLLPLCRAAGVAAATHPLLLAGLGAGPQRPPLPLGLPGEGPRAGDAGLQLGRRGGSRSVAPAGPAPRPQRVTGLLSPGQTSCSQEELGIHFAQALSCLHSCQRRIKTRAALFIGDRGTGAGGPWGPPGPAP